MHCLLQRQAPPSFPHGDHIIFALSSSVFCRSDRCSPDSHLAMKEITYIRTAQADYDEHDPQPSVYRRRSALSDCPASLVVVVLLLLGSLGLNAFLCYERFHRPWELRDDLPSKYAGLRRNVQIASGHEEDFYSVNRTVQEDAWAFKGRDTGDNVMALDNDFAASLGLPPSQSYPWDEKKSIYIMTGLHELHCAAVIRIAINQHEDSLPRAKHMWPYHHVMHCLDILREAVMCNADDTPLAIEGDPGKGDATGTRVVPGQTKQCRDWDAMSAWSRRYTACYRAVNTLDPEFDEQDRFKFCPGQEDS